MTDHDKAIIRAFATGDETQRNHAITIHRSWIKAIGVRGTLEQDFMAEVDNPAPDLVLRSRYRAALLAAPTKAR